MVFHPCRCCWFFSTVHFMKKSLYVCELKEMEFFFIFNSEMFVKSLAENDFAGGIGNKGGVIGHLYVSTLYQRPHYSK